MASRIVLAPRGMELCPCHDSRCLVTIFNDGFDDVMECNSSLRLSFSGDVFPAGNSPSPESILRLLDLEPSLPPIVKRSL